VIQAGPAIAGRTALCPEMSVSFHIQARFFVLACGGIENARLLLVSNSVLKNGIGNQNDLVGRFFMEHPHITRAKALFWAVTKFSAFMGEKLKIGFSEIESGQFSRPPSTYNVKKRF
jgi:hypothetical protein